MTFPQGGYSNLRFQAGVNWQGTNPQLWQILNAVLFASGKVGTVTSAYRTQAESAALGGGSDGDPHSRGIAADVVVGGVPIGDVPGLGQALRAAGLISGNQAGFWPGHDNAYARSASDPAGADPVHVQLPSSGGSASVPSAKAAAGGSGGAPPQGATAGCLPAAIMIGTFFSLGVAILGHLL